MLALVAAGKCLVVVEAKVLTTIFHRLVGGEMFKDVVGWSSGPLLGRNILGSVRLIIYQSVECGRDFFEGGMVVGEVCIGLLDACGCGCRC